ncbi:MAG: FtsH protease activity modulator HflK [Candidatus Eisenbacteria bacterium]|nr:FtsH protease activity modulator HflK [Candidatus Eisenbacteria bacterium]
MPDQGQPFPEIRLPKIPARTIGLLVGAVVLLAILFSSVYTIEPEEVGVILTLGRYSRTSEPGLHVKAPFGIDKLYKVPVRRQLKEEFGFRTTQAGVRSEFARRGYEDESLMLTGDLNSAVVEWIVQYKISDAEQFLFRVRAPRETFRDISEAAMREIVGDRSVTEVLTTGRVEVADEVKLILQRLCEQYELGIDVQVVVLQNVNPPAPVQPSFNEVNEAIQEKEKLINQAVADYNQAIPRAEGEAHATILAAEGYALNRVNRAKGDVALFDALLTEYRKAPDVTRRRIYVESMREILAGMERKVIVDESLRGILPLLPLGKEEVKP